MPFITPNPAGNSVEVHNYLYSNFNYEIYNAESKKVSQGVSTDKIIKVSGLPSGFYILIITNQGKSETFKLIKK